MFYIVPVTAGDPFLTVTVAWDNAPGAVNTIPELVNDLDLTLTAPERREAILLDPFEAEPTLGFEQLMEALN